MTTLAVPDMGGTGILKGGTMVLSVKPNGAGPGGTRILKRNPSPRRHVPGGTIILGDQVCQNSYTRIGVPGGTEVGGGTEILLHGSTPQSSCIQGVGIVQLFYMHVGAIQLDHLWCGSVRT